MIDSMRLFLLSFIFSFSDGDNLRASVKDFTSQGGIVSSPTEFKVKQGETVSFPCKTQNQGESVVTWHWSGKLVSAGNVKVLGDYRVHILDEGRELRLQNITWSDQGVFTCTLNLRSTPVHINHTLDILVPPVAEIVRGDFVLNITEKKRLELNCIGRGFPSPSLTWNKQGGRQVSGGVLTIPEVQRGDSGVYKCTARSTLGESADSISVNVLYKPVIKLERKLTNENTENVFSLACSVDANPPAKVSWYKDDRYLRTENYSEGPRKHILTITSLQESDYGNYTCEAISELGKTSDSVDIKGQPEQPVVLSSAQSYTNTEYTLVWKVWTPRTLPILNQSILYRLKSKANGDALRDAEGTWHNLALISDSSSQRRDDKDEYKMDLTGLQGDAEYEVRIRAMNRQGWSQLSDPFFFKTPGQLFQMNSPLFTKRQLTSLSTQLDPVACSSIIIATHILLILY